MDSTSSKFRILDKGEGGGPYVASVTYDDLKNFGIGFRRGTEEHVEARLAGVRQEHQKQLAEKDKEISELRQEVKELREAFMEVKSWVADVKTQGQTYMTKAIDSGLDAPMERAAERVFRKGLDSIVTRITNEAGERAVEKLGDMAKREIQSQAAVVIGSFQAQVEKVMEPTKVKYAKSLDSAIQEKHLSFERGPMKELEKKMEDYIRHTASNNLEGAKDLVAEFQKSFDTRINTLEKAMEAVEVASQEHLKYLRAEGIQLKSEVVNEGRAGLEQMKILLNGLVKAVQSMVVNQKDIRDDNKALMEENLKATKSSVEGMLKAFLAVERIKEVEYDEYGRPFQVTEKAVPQDLNINAK